MIKFTYEELKEIADSKLTLYSLAGKLGKSEDDLMWAIETYSIPYNVSRYKKWSEDEDALITQMRANKKSTTQMARELNRPVGSVHMRLKFLNLTSPFYSSWTEEEDNYILMGVTMGKSFSQVAEDLNKTKNAVAGRYRRIK